MDQVATLYKTIKSGWEILTKFPHIDGFDQACSVSRTNKMVIYSHTKPYMYPV